MKKLYCLILLTLVSSLCFSESWKMYSGKNSTESSTWEVSVDNNTLSATIIAFSDPDENAHFFIGHKVIYGLTKTSEGLWENGYVKPDPRKDTTYRCWAKIVNGKVELRGYVGTSIFGKSFYGEVIK